MTPKILLNENTTRKGHGSNNSGGGRNSMSKKHCWDIVQVGAIRGRNPENPSDRTTGMPTKQTLELNDGGCSNTTLSTVQKDNVVIESKTRIRRLTEVECEKLQGFPINHTQYGNYDGVVKRVSKTQRYKMCGNAVSVCVVKEIGKQLIKLFTDDGSL